MKQLLLLLRQFFTPFNGWPWAFYISAAALPVILLIGIFYPRFAFGLAVWDFIVLLAIPFMMAPKVLHSLRGNGRLGLVPGFQRRVMLALLLFTLMHSLYFALFAKLYIPEEQGLLQFRNAGLLFLINSVYVLVMQYALTTSWVVLAVNTAPAISVLAVLFATLGKAEGMLSDQTLLILSLITAAGWLLAWLRTGRHNGFRPEHGALLNWGSTHLQSRQAQLLPWLFSGGNALTAPDATLLLGYPANLMTRIRVMAYMIFVGPIGATLILVILGFGQQWDNPPSLIELFIYNTLFPAIFVAFQNVEWVSRLRLIWLRRHALRHQLWEMLERQLFINLALVLCAALMLMVAGIVFSTRRASLMWHFPLIVVLFYLYYSYYVICARASNWPAIASVFNTFIGCALLFAALFVTLAHDNTLWLLLLEVAVAIAAINLRLLARQRLATVDWLVVKPFFSMSSLASS